MHFSAFLTTFFVYYIFLHFCLSNSPSKKILCGSKGAILQKNCPIPPKYATVPNRVAIFSLFPLPLWLKFTATFRVIYRTFLPLTLESLELHAIGKTGTFFHWGYRNYGSLGFGRALISYTVSAQRWSVFVLLIEQLAMCWSMDFCSKVAAASYSSLFCQLSGKIKLLLCSKYLRERRSRCLNWKLQWLKLCV